MIEKILQSLTETNLDIIRDSYLLQISSAKNLGVDKDVLIAHVTSFVFKAAEILETSEED